MTTDGFPRLAEPEAPSEFATPTTRRKARRRTALIHREAVRRLILDTINRTRPGFPCTRVSDNALDMIDYRLGRMIRKFVHEHPTRGKTFAEIL